MFGIDTRRTTTGNHVIWRLMDALNGRHHLRALSVYLLVVAGHFAEHVIQAWQFYVLRWHPSMAGGVLGLFFPQLARNEVLHISFNSLQLTGLIVLCPGFRAHKRAMRWWMAAIVAQSWHFFEHVLLEVQYLSGHYLFGAARQTSLLEFLFPRLQLHLTYNIVVLIPTLIAVALYLRSRRSAAEALGSESGA